MAKLSKTQVDLLRRVNEHGKLTYLSGRQGHFYVTFNDKGIRVTTVWKLVDAGMLTEVSDPDWAWRSREWVVSEEGKEYLEHIVEEE